MLTLDTGASHSIIKSSLVPKVEPLRGIKLRTATGEDAQVRGKTRKQLIIGNTKFEHNFIVADIVDDVIIGVDFMIQHGLTLDLRKKLLKYANVELPLEVSNSEFEIVKAVYAESKEKIPPRAETVLWAKMKEDDGARRLWVVESAKKISESNILIGKTLVRATKDGRIPIRVLNPTNLPRLLKKGEIIGQCQEVSVVVNCEGSELSEKLSCMDSKAKPVLKTQVQEWTKNLTEQEKSKAVKMLKEFWSIFATDKNPGRTTIVKHQIDTGDARPIRQPPRRIPLAKREEGTQLIEEMQKDGVIESSVSPWSSPVVLVKKKDGSTRFCVDYRKLNDVTKKDSYPLPRIDDTLDTLSGSKWFSTLDLQSGYWQVELDEKDKEKSAFSTGDGLWQFTVMPFGLCNAPATFERLMEHVLRGLHWKTCLVYLDDIIVMGKDFDDHLRKLQEVFIRIGAAGLKLSPKKCSLFQREVKYLGHKVTMEGVQTDELKVAAVKDWPRPENLHQLRSFLGLCTYYRRFVPGFADVASSLHELTQKNRPFKWTEHQEQAFQRLKDLLCTAPILAYPVPGNRFILDTDASNTGIGGVLSQVIDGQEKVIAYYSKILAKPERNYCVTRRELLAIVESVKHFHKYLYGQQFQLRTDHAALRWLLQFKDPEGQLARWIERLQSYDFTIDHRKGGHHGNADALSRRPCNPECRHCSRAEAKEGVVDIRLLSALPAEGWTAERIRADQEADEDLNVIIKGKANDVRPTWEEMANKSPVAKAYWTQWQTLSLHDGCLYRIWESEDGRTSTKLLVVPRKRIEEIIAEYHNGSSGGHLGNTKTVEKIKKRFYWVGCQESVADWIRRCDRCIKAKGPSRRSHGKMRQYNAGAPFERIAMDIAGPFPQSTSGNKYVLVVIDYFSKWPEVYPIPNQEATTVANAFVNNWVTRFGVPMELHSDQGRNFESTTFKEVCDSFGIRKTRTTPLHPQSDGMVERFNRTLEEYLKKVVDKNQKDWDEQIPMFLMAYRSARHDTTAMTPAMTIFGTDLRLPADLKFGVATTTSNKNVDHPSARKDHMDGIHQFVRNRIGLVSDRMKARYDSKANIEGFQKGELVLLYNPQRKKGLSPKLQTHWEGPYTIIKRINDVVYRIRKSDSRRAKLKVVHLERLAPFYKNNMELVRDEQA